MNREFRMRRVLSTLLLMILMGVSAPPSAQADPFLGDGKDFVSYIGRSGVLRIFSRQANTRITVTQLNATSTVLWQTTIPTAGMMVSQNFSDVHVRVVADKPVTVLVGATAGSDSHAGYLVSDNNSRLGQTFRGYVRSELFVYCYVGQTATPAPVVTVTDVTDKGKSDDDSVTLNQSNTTFRNSNVYIWHRNNFDSDQVEVSANRDCTVMSGHRLRSNPARDHSLIAPSMHPEEQGRGYGRRFYTFVHKELGILTTQNNTKITIRDLTDNDDSRTLTLNKNQFFTSRRMPRTYNGYTQINPSPANEFDNDFVEIISDKPIVLYVGPVTSDVSEHATHSTAIPLAGGGYEYFCYVQNGVVGDLQILAPSRATQVTITTMAGANNDSSLLQRIGGTGGAAWSGPASGPVHWGSATFRTELIHLTSNTPLTVQCGDFDQNSYSFYIFAVGPVLPPYITTKPSSFGISGQPYSYDANAVDPSNTKMTYALKKAPTGATINATTGVVSWTPKGSDAGKDIDFEVEVCNSLSPKLCTNQTWSVRVVNFPATCQTQLLSNQSYLLYSPRSVLLFAYDKLTTYTVRRVDTNAVIASGFISDAGQLTSLTPSGLNQNTGFLLVTANKPISVIGGNPTGTGREATYLMSDNGTRTGKNFDGYTRRDVLIFCHRPTGSPASNIRLIDVTDQGKTNDDSITLNNANATVKGTNYEIWRRTNFDADQIRVQSNIDCTVLVGNSINGARDWATIPPSNLTSEKGAAFGTRFYAFAESDLYIFASANNTNIRIRDLSDNNDNATFTLNRNQFWSSRGGTFIAARYNGFTQKSAASPFDDDFIEITSDKPITMWLGGARLGTNYGAAVPMLKRSATSYEGFCYVQNSRAGDLKLMAGDPSTNVTITTLAGRAGDTTTTFRVGQGGTAWKGQTASGPVYFNAIDVPTQFLLEEFVRITSNKPIYAICGDLAGATQMHTAPQTLFNQPPVISGTPSTSATQGVAYSPNKVAATDPETHPVLYTLTTAPTGASINASTGVITWTPGPADGGKQIDFTVQVKDLQGNCTTRSWKVNVANVNDPPTITGNPAKNATEDKQYAYNPGVNDPDVGDTHTWKLTKKPAGATINANNGRVRWTPGDAEAGKTFDFEIEVCDKAGACTKKAWKVNVTNVNDAPKITSTAPNSASKEKPLDYTPTATDPDPNETLTWSGTKLPTGATVDPTTGRVRWTPSDTDGGKNVDFEIKVCDKAGACDTQSFTVKVEKPKSPPQIAGTPNSTAAATKVYNYRPRVLDNDPADTHTWKGNKLPTGATIDPKTGEINWTPAAGDIGKEFDFEIEVCDSTNLCATQTWKVRVSSSNQLPQIVGTPPSSAQKDRQYSYSPTVRDPDTGDTHTWTLTNGPAGATVNPKTGKLDWVPGKDDVGKEFDFSLKVCDVAGDCATQNWKVHVTQPLNTPPQITTTPATSGTQGTAYTYKPQVVDPDTGDTHTWTLSKGPSGAQLDKDTGELKWTPTSADNGKDAEFEVRVCDHKGSCATQVWNVRVGAGNNPPVIEGAPKTTAATKTPYTFTPKVTDKDAGDTHTWKGNTLPTGATIDPKTGAISWTPKPEDEGKVFNFDVEVCDDKGACSSRKWEVRVDQDTNTPPVIAGTPSTSGTSGVTYTYGPKVNDPDAGDTHVWKLKNGPTGANVDPNTGKLTWVPGATDNGKDTSFELEVCDSKGSCAQQTWKVRVGAGNKPPAIDGTPSSRAYVSQGYTYSPKVNDPDAGDTHTWKLNQKPTGATINATTGAISWTPSAADAGKEVDFEIEVCDKAGACATQSWTTKIQQPTAGNIPPQIDGLPSSDATEGKTYSYAPKVIDPDTGDTHGWRLKDAPASATIDPKTGQINWTPSSKERGKTVTFEVEVCDSAGDCATQKWNTRVAGTDNPPLISSTPGVRADVGKEYAYTPTVTDADAGDTHTWKLKKGPAGASIDPKTGALKWTPTGNDANTTPTFEVEVCDSNGNCVTQQWRVSVATGGNTPPLITGTPDVTANAGKAYSYGPKVTDPDPGDTHTWKGTSIPTGATVDSTTGAVSWTPSANDAGKKVSFEIEVCDKAGACAKQRWKVHLGANHPPVIDGAPATTAQPAKAYTFTPKVTDKDTGDTHTWKGHTLPTGATIDPKTGAISWTPAAGDAGKTFDFEIEVCDDKGDCSSRGWRVLVEGTPNTPPAITGTPSNDAVQGKVYTFAPGVSDPDIGDTHTWKLKSGPTSAKVDSNTGQLTWTPAAGDVGKDVEVEVEVCDKAGACASRKWKIRVSQDASPPQMEGTPQTLANPNVPYVFAPSVKDPDPTETYTWKGTNLPPGAKVDPNTGALTWTPKNADVDKTFDFEIEVCDSKGKCTSRKWKVRVTTGTVNTPPLITSTPPTDAKEDRLYIYRPTAVDPDTGDKHTWKLKKAPAGAKINPNTGEIDWTPAAGDVGKDIEFEVEVCDRQGRCDTQTWKVNPTPKNDPPVITSTPPKTSYVGRDVSYTPTVSDKNTGDTHTWRLTKAPPGATFDPKTGKLTWKPTTSDAGKDIDFELEVCDNGVPRLCSRQSFTLTPRNVCVVDIDCKDAQICIEDTQQQPVCVDPGCAENDPKCTTATDFCTNSSCLPDPCQSKTCSAGELCRPNDGKCIKSCAGVTCQSSETCIDGVCVSEPCAAAGKACQSDEICDNSDTNNPTCVKNPCTDVSCRHGRTCTHAGRCLDDPCGRMACPSGQRCVAGQCTDLKDCNVDIDCPTTEVCISGKCRQPGCYVNNSECQSGAVCQLTQCKKNECPTPGGQACQSGEFCRAGETQCVKTCANVSCPNGETCKDGICQKAPCAGITCKTGEVCVAGDCKKANCDTTQSVCKHGRLCSKTQNSCIDDPCAGVTCPGANEICLGGQCILKACQFDKDCPNDEICINNQYKPVTCKQDSECQTTERCIEGNCIQDSCDGKTCNQGKYCRGGNCVASCAGVFCADKKVCVDGSCTDDPCADVTCQADETCQNGKCVKDLCKSTTDACKHKRVCRVDACVEDPCSGIKCSNTETCQEGQCTGDKSCDVDIECPGDAVCVGGKCVQPGCYASQSCATAELCLDATCKVNDCDNKQCGDGETCRPKDGQCIKSCPRCADKELCKDGACVADPCADVTCQTGETCDAGKCIKDLCLANTPQCRFGRTCKTNSCIDDPCTGLTCPGNETCRNGVCYSDTPTENNKEQGDPDGGTPENTELAPEQKTDGQATDQPTSGDKIPLLASGGCGCSIGEQAPATFWLMFGLFLFAFVQRQRRH